MNVGTISTPSGACLYQKANDLPRCVGLITPIRARQAAYIPTLLPPRARGREAISRLTVRAPPRPVNHAPKPAKPTLLPAETAVLLPPQNWGAGGPPPPQHWSTEEPQPLPQQ